VDFGKLNNPDAHYKTQRERVSAHLEDPVCAGCHKITDPTGLALESFDGAGRFRQTENGAPIDTSGNLDGKPFDNVIGLGKALHDNPNLPSCLVNRVYSYGSGGTPKPADRPFMQYLTQRFAEDGYKLPDLLRTIATSDAFSRVTDVKRSAPATAPAEPAAEKIVALQPQATPN
jgi:hypothetical protein